MEILSLAILVALGSSAFAAIKIARWVGAKAEKAEQRAPKMSLENDKLEFELQVLRKQRERDLEAGGLVSGAAA